MSRSKSGGPETVVEEVEASSAAAAATNTDADMTILPIGENSAKTVVVSTRKMTLMIDQQEYL